MGMSASQARLLSLQARQSNLEYQGQQINQARTVLSQQSTALYNSLLSMTVPTPPSTTDFQTIEYSGVMGATEFTLGTITPEASGDTYNVEIKYERNGAAIKGGSYMSVSSYNEPEYLTGTFVSYEQPQTVNYIRQGIADEVQSNELESGKYNDGTDIMHSVTGSQPGYSGKYYYTDSKGNYVAADTYEEANANTKGGVVFIATTVGELKQNNPDYDWNNTDNLDYVYDHSDTGSYTTGGMTLAEFNNGIYYTTTSDGKTTQVTPGMLTQVGEDINGNALYTLPDNSLKAGNGNDKIKNPNYDPEEQAKGTTVGGNVVHNISEEVLGSSYEGALKAIANSYPEYKNASGEPDAQRISEDFQVFFQTNSAGTQVPYFVKRSELEQQATIASGTGQSQVEVFSLEANGTYTEAVQTEGCKLTFDSSGRISSIGIPIKDENGEFTGNYNTINLEAASVTDEQAYKDAYAEYEYETYLYDQKNKEINAKTEIIQQEDRNLELKLQRLDNERTQISTEIEAVEKVINDNIESSYKTFSG